MAAPRIQITYCTKCRFMMRAAWLAQELLSTFQDDIAEVAIVPGSGGIFEVKLDGEVIATNTETKQMPDPSAVKRLVRDRVAPARQIGHD